MCINPFYLYKVGKVGTVLGNENSKNKYSVLLGTVNPKIIKGIC